MCVQQHETSEPEHFSDQSGGAFLMNINTPAPAVLCFGNHTFLIENFRNASMMTRQEKTWRPRDSVSVIDGEANKTPAPRTVRLSTKTGLQRTRKASRTVKPPSREMSEYCHGQLYRCCFLDSSVLAY